MYPNKCSISYVHLRFHRRFLGAKLYHTVVSFVTGELIVEAAVNATVNRADTTTQQNQHHHHHRSSYHHHFAAVVSDRTIGAGRESNMYFDLTTPNTRSRFEGVSFNDGSALGCEDRLSSGVSISEIVTRRGLGSFFNVPERR